MIPRIPLVLTALLAVAAPGPVPPESMEGVSFEGLAPEKKALAVSILNENGCDCGCGMKVGVCRRDDAKCGRSLALATQVVDLVKQGKGRDEIVRAVLTPPSKFVQFPLSAGDSPSIGPASAKVTILHYYDYQCPFCAKILPTLDQIARDYPKDVRIVYKMHPLSMHPDAMPAAEAALAANAQGKFFEMHKALFANQRALKRESFIAAAKEIGLDVERFTKDLDSHAYAPVVEKQAKEMEDIGATGTPATFVNGRYLSGAKPYANFKDVIDEELGWVASGKRPEFKTGKNVAEASVKPARAPGPDADKVYDLAAGAAPFRGPADAKVTILHYFDYQCPFCVKIAPTLDRILQEYPKDVRVVYKMHPLSMHPQAMYAAEAALAAAAQGKFAAMNEKLITAGPALSPQKIDQFAGEVGLDAARFKKDVETHAHRAEIDAQTKEAMGVGATATPSTFVNGRFVSGARPYEDFKKMIDEEIAKAKKG